MQSKRNFITYSNDSADSIQTNPLTTSQTGMSLQMQFKRIAYWNHPSTRCWSIITLAILHIRDNRTPQITHVEVIKAERVFGDVKWDGLQHSLTWGAPYLCYTKSQRINTVT